MSEKVVATTLVARGIPQYVGKMRAAATANSQFGASAAVPAAKTGGLSRGLANAATSAGMINPALLGAGGALIAIKTVASAAIEWESAFAGVQKTVEGTDAQMARLSDGLREMSTEIPVTAGELAGIAETAGQLGIETANVESFTRVMADLGVATNMTSEQAATALARFANITQMPQEDFDRLASTVVDLGNNAATTEGEIVDMSLRLAGAATQAGMSESEIMGLATALSSVGINAEAGGTAFSKVLIEMSAAAAQGGEDLDKFAEVAGMSAQEFATAFREDPAGAVVAFVSGLGDASDAGQDLFGILADLGIEEIRMRDALLRTAGAGDVLTESINRGNTAWEGNTALAEEAARRYETTASQITILKNNIGELARDVGEKLKPAIDFVVDDLNATFTDGTLGNWLMRAAGQGVGMVFGDPFRGDIYDTTTALDKAREATAEFGSHMDGLPTRVRDVEDSIEGTGTAASTASTGLYLLADSLADTATETEEAVTQMEAYEDMVLRNVDPVYNLRRAIEDLEGAHRGVDDAQRELMDAQEQLSEVQSDGESTARDLEDAQRAVEDAERAVEDATWDVVTAITDMETAVLNGDLSFEEFETQLRRWVAEGRITSEQAQAIRDDVVDLKAEADKYHGSEFVADFSARLDRRAINDIERELSYAARTRTASISANVSVNNGGMPVQFRAHGGPVSAGDPYIVGERGPELIVPQGAGTVIPADRTAQMMAAGRPAVSGGGQSVIHNHLYIDGRKVAQSKSFIDEFGKQQTFRGRTVAA